MRPVIALLTDFGSSDHYAGTMKGVMLEICGEATLVDITHDVPPQDILGGALELAASYSYFPPGTIFLVVVDPGVGSARRGIAVGAGGYRFVAPDNGLVSLVIGDGPAEAFEITNPQYALHPISRTFEGRDRFAPAAAWLAAGAEIASCGARIEDIVRIALPEAREMDSAVEGEVVHVDRFGNLVTNISAGALDRFADGAALEVTVAGRSKMSVASTYAEIGRGSVGALIGSTGHLELSVGGGSAASALGCGRGTAVRVARRA